MADDCPESGELKITFILPYNGSGGGLVVTTYARLLQQRGHSVLLVSPSDQPQEGKLLRRFKEIISPPRSHYSLLPAEFEHRLLSRPGVVCDRDVPDADVVIATWWETAEWVLALSPSKGNKAYFVQGYEVYPWLPQRRCHATYRAPLHKIVVSRWLQDIMRREYLDEALDLVPNGVDHALFHAPRRSKQARPTVGLLHSNSAFKGFGLAVEVLDEVRRSMPELRVLSFGSENPSHPIRKFVEFVRSPPRDTLKSIYACCDVWLTASSSEGFNLPAMEAMACRTPVVSTRTGWPVEAIQQGVNGALVDVGDIEALIRATTEMLSLPDAEWQRISENAHLTVIGCSWERSTDLLEQALSRLVSGSS